MPDVFQEFFEKIQLIASFFHIQWGCCDKHHYGALASLMRDCCCATVAILFKGNEMKLSLLTIKSNLNKLYNSSEGAARGAVATWMKNEDEKLIKFHSYLLTQCVIQFATQKLVKKNSLIHKANYSEIRKLLSVISIENIKLIDHDAKHLAITASKLLLREQDYGTGLMIWMVDQMESISNFPKKESWKLIPEISDWLDTAFLKCESTIKKTTFKDESFQEDLFYKNAKEAGKDGIPSGKRNIKK